MYKISEVATMFNLNISTIRYYDKEGLLINLKKDKTNIRLFTDNDIETLRVIECLKKSGMSIKEIKEFMSWCQEGEKTLKTRQEFFKKKRKELEEEFKTLEKAMAMIKYKCWYYDEALKDGNEKRVRNITPKQMPKEILKYYEISHH